MANPVLTYQPRELGKWVFTTLQTHPLTVGTHTKTIIKVPEGTTVADLVFDQKVAATNSSGTTVITVQTDESTPKVFIGDTAINLETGANYTTLDTATTGGDAASKLRPELTSLSDNRKISINAVVVIATAAATVSAQYRIGLLLVRAVPDVGP